MPSNQLQQSLFRVPFQVENKPHQTFKSPAQFFTTQRNFDATVSQDCQAVSDMCLWMQIVFPSDVASGSAICISMRWR
jgi:hypothetical protein